ncbi:MAG: hypothetical protein M1324_04685 [Patescibacteria group bacterium]|nr:hypothetical protein [Patescibacteria group bacterium]
MTNFQQKQKIMHRLYESADLFGEEPLDIWSAESNNTKKIEENLTDLAEKPKEGINPLEQEKFNELMKAVDKFEVLAEKTKEVEKALHKATSDREEHYGSYAGKITSVDQNRERGFVALKAEVGQKLEEMIALKGDILNKLGELTDKELRTKVYERFLAERPDEVGMSSEVILETKSDGHKEDLKQRTLHHRAMEIIRPNLERKARQKESVETGTSDTVGGETAVKPVLAEEGDNDHLLPDIEMMGMGEGEKRATTKTPQVVVSQPEIKAEPPIVSTEPKIIEPKVEPEVQTHPPVEYMKIGPDGEPTSITDTIGEFGEESITAGTASEPVKSRSTDVVDYIQAEKAKIAERIGVKLEQPATEPVRKIDNFIPPTARIDQTAQAANINQAAESIKSTEIVAQPELLNQTAAQEPIINQAPSVQAPSESTEDEITMDVMPAISAQQVESEQQALEPLQKQGGGFLSGLFRRKSDGAAPTDRDGMIKHIDRQGDDLTAAHIRSMEAEQEEKAA